MRIDITPIDLTGLTHVHLLLPANPEKLIRFSWSESKDGHDYWYELMCWQMENIKGSEAVEVYLRNVKSRSQIPPDARLTDEEAQKRSNKLMAAVVVGEI